MVEAQGLTFIGPSPAHIRMMGDKIAAKQAMAALGVPLVPGSAGAVPDCQARPRGRADRLSGAHQGRRRRRRRGMKVALDARRARRGIPSPAPRPAAFGNDAVYMEKYLDQPRHIELQVLADAHGNVVHLGERDCSLQRRHQKLLEGRAPRSSTPASATARRHRDLGAAPARLPQRGHARIPVPGRAVRFIEMNTRFQVEHPVTEMVRGMDLVSEQIRIADGAPLGYARRNPIRGHAIECRINAEDPESFAPSPGRVTAFHAPGGLGVRVDSALYAGYQVPPYYDSLIAKLIVHAPTRPEAIARLRRALDEFAVVGISTTIPLHRRIVDDPAFQAGDYTIHWLERFVAESH